MANTGIIRSKSGIRGRDRKGIRARDFRRQTTDPVAKMLEPSPEYDKPKVMIETMRVDGADHLTAKDAALYELMLATARHVDMTQEWHVIDLRTVVAFLGDELKEGRVRASLKRISHTYVSYDFRSEVARAYSSSMPLALAEIRQDLKAGTACVCYSIPEPVRDAILGASTYTWLQLNLFPLFKSRYTSRLYQRLAYMSSQPTKAGRRWEIEPAELARILFYSVNDDGSVHVGSLMRRAVKPALDDFAGEDVSHLMAFKVRMRDPVRGPGRGSPVERLVFEVTARRRDFQTLKASHLSGVDMNVVGIQDPDLAPNEHPGTLLIGRAVTLTGMRGSEISNEWRAALKRAKASPGAHVVPGLQGGTLLHVLDRDSVATAFQMWIEASVQIDPDAPVIEPAAPVRPARPARPAPAFIGNEGDGDVMPAMEIAPEPEPKPEPKPESVAEASHAAALKVRRTPEEQSARLLELAQIDAQQILDLIDGWHSGRHFRCYGVEEVLPRWCDPETVPWSNLVEVPGHGTLVAAAKLLAKTDHESRKHWLGRIAWAIKDADWDRLRRVAGAVIGASKKGELARGKAPSTHRPAGFAATVVVSELSAHCGCADPAYSAGDTSYDRDAPQFETADDCPF